MGSIRALYPLPSLHSRTLYLHALPGCSVTVWLSIGSREFAEPLLGFRQFLAGMSDMPSQGERRALHQIMGLDHGVGHLVEKTDPGHPCRDPR